MPPHNFRKIRWIGNFTKILSRHSPKSSHRLYHHFRLTIISPSSSPSFYFRTILTRPFSKFDVRMPLCNSTVSTNNASFQFLLSELPCLAPLCTKTNEQSLLLTIPKNGSSSFRPLRFFLSPSHFHSLLASYAVLTVEVGTSSGLWLWCAPWNWYSSFSRLLHLPIPLNRPRLIILVVFSGADHPTKRRSRPGTAFSKISAIFSLLTLQYYECC